jgi:hypothetical protein
MPPPGFDYPALMTEALAGLVRRVLARTAEEGLPGEHHFYLTFGTADAGVEVPASLRREFPEEMTIVLQHQFWNLAVDDAGFAVTLRFGGRPERVVVPWGALRAFADPSAEFGFRLRAAESARAEPDAREAPEPPAGPAAAGAAESKVVAFRRKPE